MPKGSYTHQRKLNQTAQIYAQYQTRESPSFQVPHHPIELESAQVEQQEALQQQDAFTPDPRQPTQAIDHSFWWRSHEKDYEAIYNSSGLGEPLSSRDIDLLLDGLIDDRMPIVDTLFGWLGSWFAKPVFGSDLGHLAPNKLFWILISLAYAHENDQESEINLAIQKIRREHTNFKLATYFLSHIAKLKDSDSLAYASSCYALALAYFLERTEDFPLFKAFEEMLLRKARFQISPIRPAVRHSREFNLIALRTRAFSSLKYLVKKKSILLPPEISRALLACALNLNCFADLVEEEPEGRCYVAAKGEDFQGLNTKIFAKLYQDGTLSSADLLALCTAILNKNNTNDLWTLFMATGWKKLKISGLSFTNGQSFTKLRDELIHNLTVNHSGTKGGEAEEKQRASACILSCMLESLEVLSAEDVQLQICSVLDGILKLKYEGGQNCFSKKNNALLAFRILEKNTRFPSVKNRISEIFRSETEVRTEIFVEACELLQDNIRLARSLKNVEPFIIGSHQVEQLTQTAKESSNLRKSQAASNLIHCNDGKTIIRRSLNALVNSLDIPKERAEAIVGILEELKNEATLTEEFFEKLQRLALEEEVTSSRHNLLLCLKFAYTNCASSDTSKQAFFPLSKAVIDLCLKNLDSPDEAEIASELLMRLAQAAHVKKIEKKYCLLTLGQLAERIANEKSGMRSAEVTKRLIKTIDFLILQNHIPDKFFINALLDLYKSQTPHRKQILIIFHRILSNPDFKGFEEDFLLHFCDMALTENDFVDAYQLLEAYFHNNVYHIPEKVILNLLNTLIKRAHSFHIFELLGIIFFKRNSLPSRESLNLIIEAASSFKDTEISQFSLILINHVFRNLTLNQKNQIILESFEALRCLLENAINENIPTVMLSILAIFSEHYCDPKNPHPLIINAVPMLTRLINSDCLDENQRIKIYKIIQIYPEYFKLINEHQVKTDLSKSSDRVKIACLNCAAAYFTQMRKQNFSKEEIQQFSTHLAKTNSSTDSDSGEDSEEENEESPQQQGLIRFYQLSKTICNALTHLLGEENLARPSLKTADAISQAWHLFSSELEKPDLMNQLSINRSVEKSIIMLCEQEDCEEAENFLGFLFDKKSTLSLDQATFYKLHLAAKKSEIEKFNITELLTIVKNYPRLSWKVHQFLIDEIENSNKLEYLEVITPCLLSQPTIFELFSEKLLLSLFKNKPGAILEILHPTCKIYCLSDAIFKKFNKLILANLHLLENHEALFVLETQSQKGMPIKEDVLNLLIERLNYSNKNLISILEIIYHQLKKDKLSKPEVISSLKKKLSTLLNFEPSNSQNFTKLKLIIALLEEKDKDFFEITKKKIEIKERYELFKKQQDHYDLRIFPTAKEIESLHDFETIENFIVASLKCNDANVIRLTLKNLAELTRAEANRFFNKKPQDFVEYCTILLDLLEARGYCGDDHLNLIKFLLAKLDSGKFLDLDFVNYSLRIINKVIANTNPVNLNLIAISQQLIKYFAQLDGKNIKTHELTLKFARLQLKPECLDPEEFSYLASYGWCFHKYQELLSFQLDHQENSSQQFLDHAEDIILKRFSLTKDTLTAILNFYKKNPGFYLANKKQALLFFMEMKKHDSSFDYQDMLIKVLAENPSIELSHYYVFLLLSDKNLTQENKNLVSSLSQSENLSVLTKNIIAEFLKEPSPDLTTIIEIEFLKLAQNKPNYANIYNNIVLYLKKIKDAQNLDTEAKQLIFHHLSYLLVNPNFNLNHFSDILKSLAITTDSTLFFLPLITDPNSIDSFLFHARMLHLHQKLKLAYHPGSISASTNNTKKIHGFLSFLKTYNFSGEEVSILLESLNTENDLLFIEKLIDLLKEVNKSPNNFRRIIFSTLKSLAEKKEPKLNFQESIELIETFLLTWHLGFLPDSVQFLSVVERDISTLKKLLALGWTSEHLISLNQMIRDRLNSEKRADFFALMAAHNLSTNDSIALKNIINEHKDEDLLQKINRYALSKQPNSSDRDLATLIAIFLQSNPHIKESQAKELNEFAEKYKIKHEAYTNKLDKFLSTKQPDETEYTFFAAELKNAKKNIKSLDDFVELLVIANHALKLKIGHFLRDAQILSIAFLIFINKENRSISEQLTAEGKSDVFAICAVIKALQNKKVNICTFSETLAKRDAKQYLEFYRLFALSCEDNIEDPSENYDQDIEKPCYGAEIVYGTTQQFEFDHLRTHFKGHPTTKHKGVLRNSDVVFVDEADAEMLEGVADIAKLVDAMPSYDSLNAVHILIWDYFTKILKALVLLHRGDPTAIAAPDGQSFDIDIARKVFAASNTDEREVLRTELVALLRNALLSEDSIYPIFSHLKPLIARKLPTWVDSAWVALNEKTHKRDYVITENESGIKTITPVNLSTGETQLRTSWPDGLSQYLQLKEGLPPTTEGLTTNYVSHLHFFNLHSELIGLTGTLGNEATQALLKKLYDLPACFKFPPSAAKRLTKFDEQVCLTSEEWANQIVSSIMLHRQLGQAVLVICQTIPETNILKNKLAALKITDARIIHYSRSDRDQSIEDTHLHEGDVVIATNLAGRGTNITISDNIDKNGGLHLILASFSKNKRVDQQAEGRPGRRGHRGSFEYIINLQTVGIPGTTLAELRNSRDIIEEMGFDEFEKNELAKIKQDDKVFVKFCELLVKVRQKLKEITISNKLKNFEKIIVDSIIEQWALWLDQHNNLENTQSFEEFERSILEKITNDPEVFYKLIINPFYYVQLASAQISPAATWRDSFSDCFISGTLYDAAHDFCVRAQGMDPMMKAYTEAYLALIAIKKTAKEYKHIALGFFQSALDSYSKYVHEPLTALLSVCERLPKLHASKKHGHGMGYVRGLERNLRFSNAQMAYFGQAIDRIHESMKEAELFLPESDKAYPRCTRKKIAEHLEENQNFNQANVTFHDLRIAYDTLKLVRSDHFKVAGAFFNYSENRDLSINLSSISFKSFGDILKRAKQKDGNFLIRFFNIKILALNLPASIEKVKKLGNQKITITISRLTEDTFEKLKGLNLGFVDAPHSKQTLELSQSAEDCLKTLDVLNDFATNLQKNPDSTAATKISAERILVDLSLKNLQPDSVEALGDFSFCDLELFVNNQKQAFKLFEKIFDFMNQAKLTLYFLSRKIAIKTMTEINNSIQEEELESNANLRRTESVFPEANMRSIIYQSAANGCSYFFELMEKPPLRIITMTIIGAIAFAEISLGVSLLLLTPGVAFLNAAAVGLIVEGASDLFEVARVGVTNQHSWGSYLFQKAVSMAIILATAGYANYQSAKALSNSSTAVANMADDVAVAAAKLNQAAAQAAMNKAALHSGIVSVKTQVVHRAFQGVGAISKAVLENQISDKIINTTLEQTRRECSQMATARAQEWNKLLIQIFSFSLYTTGKNLLVRLQPELRMIARNIQKGINPRNSNPSTVNQHTLELANKYFNSVHNLLLSYEKLSNFDCLIEFIFQKANNDNPNDINTRDKLEILTLFIKKELPEGIHVELTKPDWENISRKLSKKWPAEIKHRDRILRDLTIFFELQHNFAQDNNLHVFQQNLSEEITPILGNLAIEVVSRASEKLLSLGLGIVTSFFDASILNGLASAAGSQILKALPWSRASLQVIYEPSKNKTDSYVLACDELDNAVINQQFGTSFSLINENTYLFIRKVAVQKLSVFIKFLEEFSARKTIDTSLNLALFEAGIFSLFTNFEFFPLAWRTYQNITNESFTDNITPGLINELIKTILISGSFWEYLGGKFDDIAEAFSKLVKSLENDYPIIKEHWLDLELLKAFNSILSHKIVQENFRKIAYEFFSGKTKKSDTPNYVLTSLYFLQAELISNNQRKTFIILLKEMLTSKIEHRNRKKSRLYLLLKEPKINEIINDLIMSFPVAEQSILLDTKTIKKIVLLLLNFLNSSTQGLINLANCFFQKNKFAASHFLFLAENHFLMADLCSFLNKNIDLLKEIIKNYPALDLIYQVDNLLFHQLINLVFFLAANMSSLTQNCISEEKYLFALRESMRDIKNIDINRSSKKQLLVSLIHDQADNIAELTELYQESKWLKLIVLLVKIIRTEPKLFTLLIQNHDLIRKILTRYCAAEPDASYIKQTLSQNLFAATSKNSLERAAKWQREGWVYALIDLTCILLPQQAWRLASSATCILLWQMSRLAGQAGEHEAYTPPALEVAAGLAAN